MNNPQEIHHLGRTIGRFHFDPNHFIGGVFKNKTKVEFIITPSLALDSSEDKIHFPCLWNISGRIFGKTEGSTSSLFMGNLNGSDFYSAPIKNSQCEIHWSPTAQELLEFEEYRNGQTPVFRIELYALTCLSRRIVINGKEEQLQTQSYRYFHTFEVKVPIEVWQKDMQDLGLRKYCLFELQMDSSDAGLEGINSSIQKAIDYFYNGGSVGWKDCVVQVRLALEKLDKKFPSIFRTPEDKKKAELVKWSKSERIHNLIWSVKHLTHIPHHDDEETWSRDEALLVLNNLIIISHLIQKNGT